MNGDGDAGGWWGDREATALDGGALQSPAAHDAALHIRVMGVVAGWSANGRSALPRGRKAQAILVYLAISGEGEVSRKRLTSLLWSRRWDEQARASLRQSLLELRRALHSIDRTLLSIDRDRIRLDCARVRVQGLDWRRFPLARRPADLPGGRFLESLRGLDPAFDEWIDQQVLSGEPVPAIVKVERSVSVDRQIRTWWRLDGGDGPDASHSQVSTVGKAASLVEASRDGRPVVLLSVSRDAVRGGAPTDRTALPLLRALMQVATRYRWFRLEPLDSSASGATDYRLDVTTALGTEAWKLTGRLSGPAAAATSWALQRSVSFELSSIHCVALAEQVLARLADGLGRMERDRVARLSADKCSAYDLSMVAFAQVLDIDDVSWSQGMGRLLLAIASAPEQALPYALLGLARSLGICRGSFEVSAVELAIVGQMTARATHLDPHDSFVQALAAVSRFVIDPGSVDALASCRRALDLNPNCAVAWAAEALLLGGQGEEVKARAHLLHATELMPSLQDHPLLTHFDRHVADLRRYAGQRAVVTMSSPVQAQFDPELHEGRRDSVRRSGDRLDEHVS